MPDFARTGADARAPEVATRRDLWYLLGMIRTAVIAMIGVISWAVAGSALADDAERLDVVVGETIERDVGFAIGLLCDDTTMIHADLRVSTPESNTFTVTGLAEGTTLCRVGTAPNRPTYVFEIHVIAPRHRR